MKQKHHKTRNVGLIFEILVRKLILESVVEEKSKAAYLLKKYFVPQSALYKELEIYENFSRGIKFNNEHSYAQYVDILLEMYHNVDQEKLKNELYALNSEIKKYYGLKNFYSTPVANYIQLASVYILLEMKRNKKIKIDDPKLIFSCKRVLTECLMKPSKKNIEFKRKITLSEAFKSLRNYASKYFNILTEEQKQIILMFISNNFNTLNRVRKNVLNEMNKITNNKNLSFLHEEINKCKEKIQSLYFSSANKNIIDDITKLLYSVELVDKIKQWKQLYKDNEQSA